SAVRRGPHMRSPSGPRRAQTNDFLLGFRAERVDLRPARSFQGADASKCGWHRAAWTLGARGVGDDLSDSPLSHPKRASTRDRKPRIEIAPAGRLTLVLGRTSLSAAGLTVTSVCNLVASNATSATGSLCWFASH